MEEQVRLLLEAKPLEGVNIICDSPFTDHDQKESSVGNDSATNFKPIIKKTVTYIVAAVLFNEHGEVLMMQEAKTSCLGKWYLPAGRMEPGENVVEATKREVLEETGLECEPSTLLLVESAGGAWYRFVFTGEVTGGKLKTSAEADSESLQAKWIADLGELSLRASDVLPLVERGREYITRAHNQPWHLPQLPAVHPHNKLLLRLLIVVRKQSNNKPHILVSEKIEDHLPMCEVNPINSRSLNSTLQKFLAEIFGVDLPPHRPHGVLSVEHCGKPVHANDGCCLNLLISIRAPLESVHLTDKYSWLEVEQALGENLLARLSKNMTVPLIVIR